MVSALPEDAPDSRVRILKIGGGVAVQGDHLRHVEDVVAQPVLREVGVLDRAEADDLGDLPALLLGEVGAVLVDDLAGLGDRLVQERLEADHVAVAGLVRPAVLAQDGPERDVLHRDPVISPASGHGEELLEVVALAVVDDVEEEVGIPGLPCRYWIVARSVVA